MDQSSVPQLKAKTESISRQRNIETCVKLLDSTFQRFLFSTRAVGQELYDAVIDHLQLVEYDYFDLEYTDKKGHIFWLDHLKPLQKQATEQKEFIYTFAVKFYAPHPNLLEDEFTRYLFALQIQKDLQMGRLSCNESTAALLSAFIVQGRIGDFLEDVYLDHMYLSSSQLLPTSSVSFQKKVVECHRNLIGQSPADADYNLLDTARKVELYGIRMHPAKDSAGLKLNLAVAHAGVLLYQGTGKINTFSWARIRKLSFKRKRFLIKLHPESYHPAEFVFDSRDECKSFWKQCIEHHAFFRCQAVRQDTRKRGRMVSKGSSFRYVGRTQKQLIEHVRDNYVKMPQFERSSSTGKSLGTSVPTSLLLAGLNANHATQSITVARIPDGATAIGAHSDYGPSVRERPQTDPAQRTYLTDSHLSPDSSHHPYTVAIPLMTGQTNGHAQTIYGTTQLIRDRRSYSMANDAALPGTLPRGAYLLSTAMGTASSGSYTMNSSMSIGGSPAASNSSAGSPQPDRKPVALPPEYTAQFVLPGHLRMQDLRPLSMAGLQTNAAGGGQLSLIPANWRPQMSRPTSPSPSGVLMNSCPGTTGPRPMGVAVLPSDTYASMQTSILMSNAAAAAASQHPSALMRIPSPTGTGSSQQSVTTMQQIHALSTQQQLQQYSTPVSTTPGARMNLPPGYAVLAGATGLGSRVIYVDRNTGRPLVPIIAGTGPLALNNSAQNVMQIHPQSSHLVQLVSQSTGPSGVQSPTTQTVPQSPPTTVSSTAISQSMIESKPTTAIPSSQELEESLDVLASVNSRQRRTGPPPPAPERRDSMLHHTSSTPSQRSSLVDDNPQSMNRSTSNNLGELMKERSAEDMLDSGAEDDEDGANGDATAKETRRPHPLAIGLITGPNGLNSASCLSLAGRGRSALSTRSLCMVATHDGGTDGVGGGDSDDVDNPDGLHRRRRHNGGSQSDTEQSVESCRHSLLLGRRPGDDQDHDDGYDIDDGQSVCSQPSTLRSRSASCRHGHRHRHHHRQHHHHQQPQKQQESPTTTRCQSAVDPSMNGVNGKSDSHPGVVNGGSATLPGLYKRNASSTRRISRNRLDTAYHLISDLVMTERTYGRDLSVVCVCFRQVATSLDGDEASVSQLPAPLAERLFSLLDPIYQEHQKLLAAFEARLASWDGRKLSPETTNSPETELNPLKADPDTTVYRIGDLFLANLAILPLYQSFVTEAEHLMLQCETAQRQQAELANTMRQFEAQKICYLPFYVFLLKPMRRLLQYRASLERLMRYYNETHPDAADCRVVHARLLDLIQSRWEAYKRLENTSKLLEIQRDLIGLSEFPSPLATDPVLRENGTTTTASDKSTLTLDSLSPVAITGPLIRIGRQFIREGWLQKLSKRGYQPRLFFLFSDQLVYASRTSAAFLQFKVHGQFPLHDLMVEEAEPAHSFTVFSGNCCFLVAAPSDWQRDRWLEDISRAILAAKTKPSAGLDQSASILVDVKANGIDHLIDASMTDSAQLLQRATTSVHVCWHRSFTVSTQDIIRANEYETSGYLLRKFKNSNGWQRLWVVFTQNCLFFYKSYRDDCPLASLPLLGYTITTPAVDDQLRRDNVIKLQFKNHVYFFRGETVYAFDRWFEYLSSAAGTSRRPRG